MPTPRGLLLSFSVLILVGGAPPAWATIDNFKTYKAAYPGKEPKAYSCKLCHRNAIGKKGDLNAYGLSLLKLKGEGAAKKLEEKDFRALDAEDADGDGATNLDEWNAGTDVADPTSTPPGTKKPEQTTAPSSSVPASKPAGEKPSSREPSASEELHAYLIELVDSEAWADEHAAESSSHSKSEQNVTPAAEYVGTETCAACHVKQAEEFKHSTHARLAIPGGTGAQGCETCHGPGSLHAEAGGGKGVGGIINPRKDPSTCFECHLDKKAEFRLPYHHPVLEGKMSCSDCHSAHGEDVRPWSSTSLKDINEACFACHKDQRGPFVNEHEALREGCATCHKVHGSIHDKLLLVRDNNLCLRCHTQTNFPTIGGSSHSSRLYQGSCFSAGCHTAVHGSNFDEHLRY